MRTKCIFALMIFLFVTFSALHAQPILSTEYQFAYFDSAGRCHIILGEKELQKLESGLLHHLFETGGNFCDSLRRDESGYVKVAYDMGIYPGDQFVVQKPTPRGDGGYINVKVTGIYYHPLYDYGRIIPPRVEIWAEPLGDVAGLDGYLIAKLYGHQSPPKKLETEIIPDNILKRIADAAVQWLGGLSAANKHMIDSLDDMRRDSLIENILSVQPFHSKSGSRRIDEYYLTIFHAPHDFRDTTTCLIFDDKGENLGGPILKSPTIPICLAGITDLHGDGNNQVAVACGEDRGGVGGMILCGRRTEDNHWILEEENRIYTVWEGSGGSETFPCPK
ncbi:exported hypothetical protein [Candidatus Zixiibacteriota bacterium]|nr:exported hypothetical protein [candidate division Zixibacteria bacterium]